MHCSWALTCTGPLALRAWQMLSRQMYLTSSLVLFSIKWSLMYDKYWQKSSPPLHLVWVLLPVFNSFKRGHKWISKRWSCSFAACTLYENVVLSPDLLICRMWCSSRHWSLCFSANFSSWSASCSFGDQTCSLASIQAIESNLFLAQHPLLLQYVDPVHASSLTQK